MTREKPEKNKQNVFLPFFPQRRYENILSYFLKAILPIFFFKLRVPIVNRSESIEKRVPTLILYKTKTILV